MDLNLLQANINHCARAQDLLFQSMAQWSIHVAVVAEPYRVPSGDNWVGDTDGVVAMTSRSIVGSPAFVNVVRGRGYVSAFIDDVMVVGVYFSPNKSLADFEQFLAEVGVLINRRRSCHPNEEPRATDLRYRSPDEKRPRVGRRTECSWYASDGVWRPRKGPPVEGLPRQTPLAGMWKIAQVFPCPSH
ncbi:uncharacterized protein LOC120634115 [Pararge aegeria]|uniref:uncharacterized protein LOC120634115 n=1 Tax=Pararge aegeria TaxID=116150 RepID=UPI0019D1B376|nr:uncharacterized protein LOC120634115 [Pararge aegeria]